MSNSVQPHRRQPTRLPYPWDSLGKNTGMGCHFLLQCMKVKSQSKVTQSCPTLRDPMDCSLSGSSVHGDFQARVLEWGAIAFSRGRGLVTANLVLFSLPLCLWDERHWLLNLTQPQNHRSEHWYMATLTDCIFSFGGFSAKNCKVE